MNTTNETKHTPGPWSLTAFVREPDASAPTGRRARIVSECDAADGFVVSATNAGIADIARKGGLADARLIAAAPDLLKMLKEAVSHDNALKAEWKVPPRLLADMQKAIARAEGE